MDARERLRQYLEQRRELGERELMLDGLKIDEVLKLVGAAGAAERRPPAAPMKPLGGTPDAPSAAAAKLAAEQRAAAEGAELARLQAAREPMPNAAPPEPPMPAGEPRAAETPASDDWRAALRAAGAERPAGAVVRPDDTEVPREGEDEMARKAAARGSAKERDGMEQSPAPGAATPDGGASASQPAAPVKGVDAPAGLAVGVAPDAEPNPFSRVTTLDGLAEKIRACTRCDLYKSATHAVPGEGNADADVVVVGEAPGEKEDLSGRPFVGASGELLTKILAAIKLRREDVFIVNVLKHRPPGNRNPKPDEVVACSPYLVRQLEILRPKVIICFGTFAAQTLLDTKTPIGKLRGAVHRYYGVPLVVTYHPAALLRNPAWKRPAWEDVQLARRILDRSTGA